MCCRKVIFKNPSWKQELNIGIIYSTCACYIHTVHAKYRHTGHLQICKTSHTDIICSVCTYTHIYPEKSVKSFNIFPFKYQHFQWHTFKTSSSIPAADAHRCLRVLGQRLAGTFRKGPNPVTVSGSGGSAVPVAVTVRGGHRRDTNSWVWLCASKTLSWTLMFEF